LDLGGIPYIPAFIIQERVFKARFEGRVQTVVILQENPPTITIGRAGSRQNLLTTEDDLNQRGIEVLEVNRGGDITYHGPGQIIASPIFYLGDLDLNANQYLHSLEDVLIDVLESYGIQAGKNADYPGVWVDQAKVGAVGIAVRHGYTFHGLSLNVNLDLSPYELIHPCGIPEMPVTSMAKVLGRELPLPEVKFRLRQSMSTLYLFDFHDINWDVLEYQISDQ
jgi:lipoate-protein ligase B